MIAGMMGHGDDTGSLHGYTGDGNHLPTYTFNTFPNILIMFGCLLMYREWEYCFCSSEKFTEEKTQVVLTYLTN